MQRVITEHYPNPEIEEVTHEYGNAPTDRLEQIGKPDESSIPTLPYSALVMPGSREALMAVVDDNGYLIPVCTAGDLLRGCKYFWRASQD